MWRGEYRLHCWWSLWAWWLLSCKTRLWCFHIMTGRSSFCANLQHGSGVLSVGCGVPEVAGEEPPGDCIARARQQPLPLDSHTVLLVPLRSRPAWRHMNF